MSKNPPIAIIMKSLEGGGIERVVIDLAKSLADRGHEVDIVLLSAYGDYRYEEFSRFSFYYANLRLGSLGLLTYFRRHNVKAHMLVTDLISRTLARFALKRHWPDLRVYRNRIRRGAAICRYIQMRRPKIILAQAPSAILATLDGRHLAGTSLPMVASFHNATDFEKPRLHLEMRKMLPEADAVVGVSRGVAESAIRNWKIGKEKVLAIYNPINPDIPRLRDAEIIHPWFENNASPVILTVARIAPQKDFSTLLSAFALVCEKRDARLVIMSPQGKSKAVGPLISQADKLGILKKIDILGFDQNPYRYMRRSACFVLSTFHEGLPTVLIEALACGTPVVSSDAPYGPSEILEDGKWGKLVPIEDAPAMACAIMETLDGDRPDASELEARSRFFSADRATEKYEALIRRLSD